MVLFPTGPNKDMNRQRLLLHTRPINGNNGEEYCIQLDQLKTAMDKNYCFNWADLRQQETKSVKNLNIARVSSHRRIADPTSFCKPGRNSYN